MELITGILTDINTELAAQRAAEKRSFVNAPVSLASPEAWMFEFLNGGGERSDAGVRVSELGAFAIATFHSCVDLVSSALAALPAHVYERTIKNDRQIRNIAHDHYMYDVIHTEPNADILDVDLLDVSAVTYPAYSGTSVEARSKFMFPEGAPERRAEQPAAPSEEVKPESEDHSAEIDCMRMRIQVAMT